MPNMPTLPEYVLIVPLCPKCESNTSTIVIREPAWWRPVTMQHQLRAAWGWRTELSFVRDRACRRAQLLLWNFLREVIYLLYGRAYMYVLGNIR